MTYPELDNLGTHLEQVRARLSGRLRALADGLDRAPLEQIAEAAPTMAGTINDWVRRAPRVFGVYLYLPTPEPGDEIGTGPIDPRFVTRDHPSRY